MFLPKFEIMVGNGLNIVEKFMACGIDRFAHEEALQGLTTGASAGGQQFDAIREPVAAIGQEKELIQECNGLLGRSVTGHGDGQFLGLFGRSGRHHLTQQTGRGIGYRLRKITALGPDSQISGVVEDGKW